MVVFLYLRGLDGEQGGKITVAEGDDIIAMAAVGEQIYVSTSGGRVIC